MAATHPSHLPWAVSARFLLLALPLLLGTAGPAAGQEQAAAERAEAADAGLAVARVRAVDATAGTLLQAGLSCSESFRELVAALQRSDLFVYVETALPGRVPGSHRLLGQTRVSASTPAGRFLRITISVPDVHAQLVSTLGHELQHAVEIALAPHVTDEPTRILHFRAIGSPTGPRTRCTAAAQEAGARILDEIRAAVSAR